VAAQLVPAVGADVAEQTVRGVPWVAFYAANWARAFGTQIGLFGHTWSLAIEEQFYIVWPVTLAVVLGSGQRLWRGISTCLVVAGVIAVNRAVAWLGGAGVDRVSNGTDTQADALLIGCALALALHAGIRVRPPAALTWLAAMFLAWVVATQNVFSLFLYLGGLTAVALSAAVVIVALLDAPGLLGLRPFVALGRISYGVYLWQFPVVFLVPLGWPLPIRVIAVVGITLSVASASWWLIERRFLRLKRPRAG
jgi:peptidoglycan/LPS O-acetylase OafA/YrhL